VSLESGVLSRYTAFVVVDEAETIDSQAPPVEIIQPVEMVAGCMPLMAVQDHYVVECRDADDDCFAEPQVLMCNPAELPRPVDRSRWNVEEVAGELLDALEGLHALQPPDDPVKVVADFSKRLKNLRKLARRKRHSWTDAIEELYTETSVYLKWLRRPKQQPGPYATLEAWIKRASDLLRQLVGEHEEVMEVSERFWI